MAGRDPKAYARRNAGVLTAAFGAAVLLGLAAGNGAAILGGAGGLLWVLWARRGGA